MGRHLIGEGQESHFMLEKWYEEKVEVGICMINCRDSEQTSMTEALGLSWEMVVQNLESYAGVHCEKF